MTVRGMRLLEVESRRKGGQVVRLALILGRGKAGRGNKLATFDFIPLMEKGKGRAHLSEMKNCLLSLVV